MAQKIIFALIAFTGFLLIYITQTVLDKLVFLGNYGMDVAGLYSLYNMVIVWLLIAWYIAVIASLLHLYHKSKPTQYDEY